MSSVSCIMIGDIPRGVQRAHLLEHFSHPDYGGAGPVEYILHPLGNDMSMAVIKFIQADAASSVLQHHHRLNGVDLQVALLPRQVLAQCQADVDPLIVVGLPDIVACMDLLRTDFGVNVHYDSLIRTMSLSGSFLQIQFAQSALNSIYRQQEELRHKKLAEAADKTIDLPLRGAIDEGFQRFQHAENCPEPQTFSPLSFRSDHFSDTESPVRTLHLEDLRAMLPQKSPPLSPNLDEGVLTSPCLSARSNISLGNRSIQEILTEKLSQSLQSSNGILPVASSMEMQTCRENVSSIPVDESLYQQNENAVDNLFASTIGLTRTGPQSSESIQENELMTSGEFMGTRSTLGEASTLGKSDQRVMVEFDTQLFDYMRRVHGQTLKDLERSYLVQLQYKKTKESTVVRILPAGTEDSLIAPYQARSPLIKLYKTSVQGVTIRDIPLQGLPSKMVPMMNQVITKVKEDFRSKVFVDVRDKNKVTLTGEGQQVQAAEGYICNTLDLKKAAITIKPKMALTMQVTNISIAAKEQVTMSKAHTMSSVPDDIILHSSRSVHLPAEESRHQNSLSSLVGNASVIEFPQSLRSDVQSRQEFIRSSRESNKSPRKSVESPREYVKSPRQSITSPRESGEAITSPTQSITSQLESIKSPRESAVQSPQEFIKSPRESNKSPRESVKSPRGYVKSPRQSITSPRESREAITSPRQSITSQFESIKSPRESAIQSPREFINSPREAIASPRQSVTSQWESITSPRESIRSPRDSIECPRESIKSPNESIKSPRESIKSPRDCLTSPRESIRSLGQSFTASRESINSPSKSIRSAKESLKNPRGSMQSPRESFRGSCSSIYSPRQSVTSPRHSLTNESSDRLVQSPRETTQSPVSMEETVVGSNLDASFQQKSSNTVVQSSVQFNKSSPCIAWPASESPRMHLPQGTSESAQFSMHTSITGVTPLSSRDFSTGELSVNRLPYTSIGQSLDPDLTKSVELNLSHGSITSKPDNHLSRVSFDSTGKSLYASGEFPRISTQDLERFKLVTKEGVKVSVYTGELVEAQVDVVVCPVPEDMRLLHGVALNVSTAAGYQLQEKCTECIVKHGPLKTSEVFAVAASGILRCTHVMFAVGPMWCLYPDKLVCETVLKQTFINALTAANKDLKASSVALPPISTGELGVPVDVCAWAMLAAIEEFSSEVENNQIKDIHIINADSSMTSTIGQTLQEVLGERESSHATPVLSPVLSPRTFKPTAIPFIVRLMAACVTISEHAGAIIRDILQKGELGIIDKGINDLQTEADRSAERCIIASLKAQFPGIVTVGEESGKMTVVEVNPDWIEMGQSAQVLEICQDLGEELCTVELRDVVVWVDPLDGTSEYTQGLLEHVTTLIGVGVKGKAMAGVIHQPFYNYHAAAFVPRGRSMWGIIGVGAYGFKSKPTPEGNIIVTTRSHGSGAVGEAVSACKPTEVVRVGGCGHKVALILEGAAHAYVFASPGCKKWDTAAPEAILHAAGGTLTDIHGNQLKYGEYVQRRNAAGVLATPAGTDHDWYLQRIPASVREALPVIASIKKLDDPMHTLTPRTSADLSPKKVAPFIAQLTAACVMISERAGIIIREIMQKGELGIVEKGINDLQTEADRSAERCIVASLKAQFPGIVTLGEESGKTLEVDVHSDWIEMSQSADVLDTCQDLSEELCRVELSDVVVWVNPLDGTSEYTQGLLGHVTTLIGVGVKGKAMAGVIHQPLYNYQAAAFVPRGRSMWGIIGVGAYGLKPKPTPEGNIIVTTRSHGSRAVGEAVSACEPTEVVRVGGCGHKVALILEGAAHAYVFASPGCKKWDTAAPEAILHAAGGTLTDIHGNQLEYEEYVQRRNAAGVLATPAGADHDWYLQRIPASVREALPVIASTKKLDDPMHTLTPSIHSTTETPGLSHREDNQSTVENSSSLMPVAIIPSITPANGTLFVGGQPKSGKMSFEVDRKVQLPGYSESATIVITYAFSAGKQEEHHPSPGKPYDAATFTSFLPNTQDGRHVLQLLRKAFDLGMTFTVQDSLIGDENTGNITWTDIPHKTAMDGGISGNGYPDDDYVEDVRYLLHERGITANPPQSVND